MIPNALVIAFDSRVRFEPSKSANGHPYVRPGEIVIPLDGETPDYDKPGWIVDGQQRTAAIREARIDRWPIFVTAFITDDEQHHRSQFILVNSTRPLPRSLIYELLPSTSDRLPLRLETRKFPAYLLERLNFDDGSPLREMIRTPTAPDGVIKDNSMLRMLENSLTDGVLYDFRDPDTGEGDVDAMLSILMNYWRAVAESFPNAWGLSPRKSRLVHGVGVVSLGFLMDAIADDIYLESHELVPTTEDFGRGLNVIASVCKWTSGTWDFGGGVTRRWNELQNLQRDINLLTNHLLGTYRRERVGY
jgi:DGQHR domain-containing protein